MNSLKTNKNKGNKNSQREVYTGTKSDRGINFSDSDRYASEKF